MSTAIGFLSPWLLWGLVILPVLWLLLRAIPPSPLRQRFPGTGLLLGLKDEDAISARTPWWLLLLRMLALAALIVGLAGPVLNPDPNRTLRPDVPLLIVLDGSWASARDQGAVTDEVRGLLDQAGRQARQVGLLRLSAPEPVRFGAAAELKSMIGAQTPLPWETQPADWQAIFGQAAFDTVWISDGLAQAQRPDVLAALQSHGRVDVRQSTRPLFVLDPVQIDDGKLLITARRLSAGPEAALTVAGIGPDPAGVVTTLTAQELSFADGESTAQLELSLPTELRARITRFELVGQHHAGAVSLSADSLRRREVALIAGREDREGLDLLSPLHYLEQALKPTADLLHGGIQDVLPATPDVVILADVAQLSPADEDALLSWVNKGGTLMRFAGPRLAASDVSRSSEDPLLPVRLRAGGRTVGGAMSWGEPRKLAEFDPDSPFAGLKIPDDVLVSAQVLAQPDPDLSARVIARLEDGTPLVTRKSVGAGQVVLFHVTANTDWSNLPISGLFVDILERLAVASIDASANPEDLEGTVWQPLTVLDASGRPDKAGNLPGVAGTALLTAPLGPELQPGVYQSGDRALARNVISADTELTPASWPATVSVHALAERGEVPLAGWCLGLALVLLSVDIAATLALSGRLWQIRAAVLILAALLMPHPAPAQETAAPAQEVSDQAKAASFDLVLGHVLTGNAEVDKVAQQGLQGLSQILSYRTSVEPAEPAAVDLEKDDLAVYPMLYWPITAEQPSPSADAYARLNAYLRTGGMIVFDTRDADLSGTGAASGSAARLKALAAPLDIPSLEPVPPDHVLTRTFYLLQDFPGRYQGRDVWVEAAPPDAEQAQGVPFRNLNDGVSPVIIGGNDWAAAWAVDEHGMARFPVGSGYDGERQREIAYRFGVNLVMYVLTGNYKSDQVHVPALLERLGQ